MRLTKHEQELIDYAKNEPELKNALKRARELHLSEWQILRAIDKCELLQLVEIAEAFYQLRRVRNDILFKNVYDAIMDGVCFHNKDGFYPVDGMKASELKNALGVGNATIDVLVEMGRVIDDRKKKCSCGKAIKNAFNYCPFCGKQIHR